MIRIFLGEGPRTEFFSEVLPYHRPALIERLLSIYAKELPRGPLGGMARGYARPTDKARPHPGPLPQEREERGAAMDKVQDKV